MKKYRVFKTFPVSAAGTWHTEEFIIEGLLMVKIDVEREVIIGWTIMGEDNKVKAIFSMEYSVIEITNQQ